MTYASELSREKRAFNRRPHRDGNEKELIDKLPFFQGQQHFQTFPQQLSHRFYSSTIISISRSAIDGLTFLRQLNRIQGEEEQEHRE